MKYEGTMDKECIELCDAINELKGILTANSCCGHGNDPYRIWLKTSDLKALPDLLYWFDKCHIGYDGWHMEIYTDCAKSYPTLMIEGPIGEQAYKESIEIAKFIRKDMNKRYTEENTIFENEKRKMIDKGEWL